MKTCHFACTNPAHLQALHPSGLTLSRIKCFLTSKEHSKTSEAKAQELVLSVAHRCFRFQNRVNFPSRAVGTLELVYQTSEPLPCKSHWLVACGAALCCARPEAFPCESHLRQRSAASADISDQAAERVALPCTSSAALHGALCHPRAGASAVSAHGGVCCCCPSFWRNPCSGEPHLQPAR